MALGVLLAALPATVRGGVVPRALPAAKYKGETKRGKRIVVRVKSDGERGVLRLRCAGVRDRFQIGDDGRFVAKVERRGRVTFKAKGRFSKLKKARGTVQRVRGRGRRCSPGRFRARLADFELRSKTVSYGPYHVEPTGGHGHGGGGGHNVAMRNVQLPCEDCFLVAMVPDLVDAEGNSVNFDEEAMLHHIVFTNRAARDATCTGRAERFYASGNERTAAVLPAGFGYRVRPGDRWNTLAHVMNMGNTARMLHVEVTFHYAPIEAALREVRPLWLDIDNCGNSEYSIPPGSSQASWDLTVTPDLEGRVAAAAGHLHDDGVQIELRNTTRNELLCQARAGYGSDPSYMGHIESMGRCYGDPVGLVGTGDVLRIRSAYDSPTAQHDVMGIVLAYLAPEQVD